MSKVNGKKSAHEWIEKHKPENGWFRIYWPKMGTNEPIWNEEDGSCLRWEWKYDDGKRADGISKGWHRDGTLKQIKHYKDGVKHGELIRYYTNGQINDHFFYKDGKRHGTFTSYFNTGECRGQGVYNNGVFEKYTIKTKIKPTFGIKHKVSYIIVWSDTNTLNRTDPKCHSVITELINKKLMSHTLSLVDQILALNPHEILIMDNEGNFPKHENSLVKVIPSYQSVGYLDGERPEWLDKINIVDYRDDRDFSAAKSTAMAYNHGLTIATGDYLVLQHNDTEYLFDTYSEKEVIHDAIDLLERENYEYITIDRKPVKKEEYSKYEYFADCYWFLCRKDFYFKHNIWVDWIRGDNNHLATITCYDKGLKYLHLPGFYETYETDKKVFFDKYNFKNIFGQLHTLNDIPFLIHFKGGTGLYRILKENR